MRGRAPGMGRAMGRAMAQGIGMALLAGLLAGCALPVSVPNSGPDYTPVQPAPPEGAGAAPSLDAPPPPPGARSAEALDTTTPEQRAAATASPAPAAQAASLGKTTVSLGDPTAPGFWLKSPLVKTPGPGLVKTAAGATVQVDLQPGEGNSQLSLAAFRALNLPLTDLPEVELFPR